MDRLDQLIAYCKEKGFVFQSGAIYGGISGFFDYGPLGVQLKSELIQSYIRYFVQSRENIIQQEGSLVTNPKVWDASGHLRRRQKLDVISSFLRKSFE
jgi:glycyl-tRNA synthetase